MEHDNGEEAKKLTGKTAIKAASTLNPQTGVTSKATDKFSSGKWREKTGSYVTSIHNLNEGSLEDIVNLSMKFMSSFKSRQMASVATALPNDNNDIRACLVESWHVFSRTAVC